MGPLSAKLSHGLQLNQAKVVLDNKRKEEMHKLKLQAQAQKEQQAMRQKEELHQAKLSDMGGGGGAPLGKPEMPLEGTPTNPEAGKKDTIPVFLAKDEAVIPAESATLPENKQIIAALVQQGRDMQGYSKGTTSVKPIAGRLQNENLLPLIPKIGKGKRMRGYQYGTTSIPSGVLGLEDENAIPGMVTPQTNLLGATIPPAVTPEYEAPTYWDSVKDRAREMFVDPIVGKPQAAPIPAPVTTAPVQQVPPQVVTEAPTSTPVGTQVVPRLSVAERNNNPGNLKFIGQEGAVQGDKATDGGYFARFETPEAGMAALQRDISVKIDRDKTIRGIISRYAPPNGHNNTDAYIANVSARLGLDPDAPVPLDKRDALIAAIIKQEGGGSVGGVPPKGVASNSPVPQLQAPGTAPLKSHSTSTSTTGTSVDWDKVSPAPDYNNILKSYQDAVPTVESLITKHGNDKDSFVEAFKDMFSYRGLKDLFSVNDGDLAKAAIATLVGKARGFSTADSFGYAGKMLYQTSQTRQAQQLSEANAAKRTVATMAGEARQNANNQYKGEMTTWKTEVEANKKRVTERIADGLKAAQARGKDVEGMYQKIIDGTSNLPIEHRQAIINNAVAAMGSSTDPDAVFNKLLGVYTQSAANREASLKPVTVLRVSDGKPMKAFESKSGALYDENDNRIDPRTVNLADDMKGDKERGADQLAVAFPDKIQDPKDPTKMIDNPYGGKEIRATMAESIIATGGRTTPQNMGAIGHIASAKLAKSKMPMTLGNAMLAIKDAVIERMNPAGSYQVIVDGTKTGAADPAQSMGITRQITSYAEEKNLDVGTVVKDIDAKWEQLKKNPVDYQKVLRATPPGQSPAVFFYTTKNKAELFR